MMNLEYYRDQIEYMGSTVSSVGVGFIHIYNKYSGKSYDTDKNIQDIINWLLQEHKEPIKISLAEKMILTTKEKQYLENVIKPFKDRVIGIQKKYTGGSEYLRIKYEEYFKSSLPSYTSLPCFEIGTMYKGMEIEKIYSLKELELFVED